MARPRPPGPLAKNRLQAGSLEPCVGGHTALGLIGHLFHHVELPHRHGVIMVSVCVVVSGVLARDRVKTNVARTRVCCSPIIVLMCDW